MLASILKFFQYDDDNKQESYAKLLWLIKLRWLAIVILFFISIPLLLSGFLTRNSFPIYIAVLGLLMLLNFFIHVLFVKTRNEVSVWFVTTQFYIDSLALFSLIYICGGIFTPLIVFLCINSSLAALLLTHEHKRYFLLFLLVASGLLVYSSWADSSGLLTEKEIWFVCGFLLLLFAVWFIMDIVGRFFSLQNQKKMQILVKQEKRDRLRALGALAAGFSHEFASPLNAARLILDRLKVNYRNSAYEDDFSAAEKAIQACELVLKQMNFSQMDSRQNFFKTVNMKAFLKDVTESWCEEHPSCVLESGVDDHSCEIPIIPFAQTVINLLDNAYQANPKGIVVLRFYKDEFHFKMDISDTGNGFSKEILSRIGEPFLTTKVEGTGLGLYVSELLAQTLSGELVIENKKNEVGARVSLLWPSLVTDGYRVE